MFSRFFIERPIFASVISIVIIIAGLLTLFSLPIAQYPEITPPTVKVSAVYPGANATVIAESLAAPIEEEVNGVEGMVYMSGTCSANGTYDLTVTFEVGTDLDMAQVLVQNRVSKAEARLPQEARQQGISVKKQSSNILAMVALSSPDGRYDELYLSNYAMLHLRNEMARINGVGDVSIFGASDYGMRIWLDPEKLKSRKLTTTDVINAVKEQNVQVAAGQIGQYPAPEGQNFQYTINTQGRLNEVSQFEDIIIKTGKGGRFTRLKDVARVELGAKDYFSFAQLNGKPACLMAIYQLPGANALEVMDRVQADMEELSPSFPEGVEYSIPFDTTTFVRVSIKEVVITLIEAMLLVILTILIFLQDWRSTIVPALTIPVSLIGTFAVMGLMGFSLNMITLFGLVLAIGIVVDDAIVVVENTMRNMEEFGMDAKTAAIKAMEEVSGPVVATTLVLLAVFVPSAFLTGITGELYRQFALTIAVSTVFSSVNALTLSPAMCAILLKPVPERTNLFSRTFEKYFGKLNSLYNRTVGMILRRSAIMMIVFLGLSALTLLGFMRLPAGFLPDEDQGYLMATAQLPDAASVERTLKVTEEMNRILSGTEGIQDYIAIPGFSIMDGTTASNAVAFWIILKPWEERTAKELSVPGIRNRLMAEFSRMQEALAFAFIPPPITGLGTAGGFEMMVQDRGNAGLNQLQAVTQELVQDAGAQTGLTGLNTAFRANVPQLYADVDRVKAKNIGVPLSDIFATLQVNLGSAYINDFSKFGKTYQVKVQAEPQFRANIEDIRKLEVRDQQGNMLPLATLINVKESIGPQIIRRYNTYPAASVNGSPAPGYSSGDALKLMENVATAKLPASMGFEWTGISFQEKAAGNEAVYIYMLSVLLVFLVLCAQYESWSVPVGVIMVIPPALLGTIAALFFAGMDINVYTQIGIVLLVALASKNAILIVEFAKEKRESGKGIAEAALESAKLRFRPILMTSLSFVLGVFPLVTATGAGAGSRRSVGMAVFGGMIAATLMSVLLVPLFYTLVQGISERLGKMKTADKSPIPAVKISG
ncbi:MAG: multidrug efflux RND transporter permease subunit, partial [Desulfococcaceae bacterium]|nr:multidrug efflux RND transporter permease subunit [Desulfococcaceae bacterium]